LLEGEGVCEGATGCRLVVREAVAPWKPWLRYPSKTPNLARRQSSGRRGRACRGAKPVARKAVVQWWPWSAAAALPLGKAGSAKARFLQGCRLVEVPVDWYRCAAREEGVCEGKEPVAHKVAVWPLVSCRPVVASAVRSEDHQPLHAGKAVAAGSAFAKVQRQSLAKLSPGGGYGRLPLLCCLKRKRFARVRCQLPAKPSPGGSPGWLPPWCWKVRSQMPARWSRTKEDDTSFRIGSPAHQCVPGRYAPPGSHTQSDEPKGFKGKSCPPGKKNKTPER